MHPRPTPGLLIWRPCLRPHPDGDQGQGTCRVRVSRSLAAAVPRGTVRKGAWQQATRTANAELPPPRGYAPPAGGRRSSARLRTRGPGPNSRAPAHRDSAALAQAPRSGGLAAQQPPRDTSPQWESRSSNGRSRPARFVLPPREVPRGDGYAGHFDPAAVWKCRRLVNGSRRPAVLRKYLGKESVYLADVAELDKGDVDKNQVLRGKPSR